MKKTASVKRQEIQIKQLLDAFSVLRFVAGGKESLKRKILSGLIIRPGLELSGFIPAKYDNQVYLFGKREKEFIESEINKKKFLKSVESLLRQKPSCLIFDYDYECPSWMINLANKHGVAVCQVKEDDFSFSYHLQNFLAQTFVPSDELHASCLSIFGCGVIIIGESGVGKSEVALELIKKKHLFICDDRVILKRVGWNIQATSPAVIKNLIEVRGIGILDVKHMFGVQACLDSIEVSVIIKLLSFNTRVGEVERLGSDPKYKSILGVPITFYELPVRHGRTMSELVETSVIGYLLRKDGMDTTKEINKRIRLEQIKGEEN